tara:strand:+ start:424 stop:579 length:156 start_codon:yes stop_codon:yes gene_type:complete
MFGAMRARPMRAMRARPMRAMRAKRGGQRGGGGGGFLPDLNCFCFEIVNKK